MRCSGVTAAKVYGSCLEKKDFGPRCRQGPVSNRCVAEIRKHFEGSKPGSNTQIGPKGFLRQLLSCRHNEEDCSDVESRRRSEVLWSRNPEPPQRRPKAHKTGNAHGSVAKNEAGPALFAPNHARDPIVAAGTHGPLHRAGPLAGEPDGDSTKTWGIGPKK